MNELDALLSEDYDFGVGPLLPTAALRRRLRAMPQVRAIVDALKAQSIAEDDLKAFVGACVDRFRPGETFGADLAFASLAVVFEERGTDFASEFLDTIADLNLREMATSVRIARASAADD